jgi:hypothetical protein
MFKIKLSAVQPSLWIASLFFSLSLQFAHPQGPSNQLNQFGESQDFGVDSIDLTSLAVRFDPTLLHKAGRGQNLDLRMSYVTDSVLSNRSLGWTPILQSLVGKVSYSLAGCGNHGCGYNKWQYTDPLGTLHDFPGALATSGVSPTKTSGTATDGTGLVLTPGTPLATISGPSGASWQVPSAQAGQGFTPSGFIQDFNGNMVSETGTSITDTLGATVQVSNYTQIGNIISNPPPETYTFSDSTGASRSLTINTALYQITSTFPASPCQENYLTSSEINMQLDLPLSISLPNGTAYTFLYEPSSSPAGSITGRIGQITLPTGGTISYTYPSATSLVQNYQNCMDNGAFFASADVL